MYDIPYISNTKKSSKDKSQPFHLPNIINYYIKNILHLFIHNSIYIYICILLIYKYCSINVWNTIYIFAQTQKPKKSSKDKSPPSSTFPPSTHCYPSTMSKSVAGGAIRSRYVAGHSPSAASPSSKAKNNPCFASHLLLDTDPRHSPDGGALGVAN